MSLRKRLLGGPGPPPARRLMLGSRRRRRGVGVQRRAPRGQGSPSGGPPVLLHRHRPAL